MVADGSFQRHVVLDLNEGVLSKHTDKNRNYFK